MQIILSSTDDIYSNDGQFLHSTNGKIADSKTHIKVSCNPKYFKVEFNCLDNPYTDENTMKNHNEPLFNQEVFEVFISPGVEDPIEYLEVEINPNGALWIGRIGNFGLGEGQIENLGLIPPEYSGIVYSVEKADDSWSGKLHIPWELIGESPEGEYRLNFYRIRSKVSHPDADWKCNADECDFLCWQSTLSGKFPAFHKPRRFGYLVVGV